jgi:hypothetical protein
MNRDGDNHFYMRLKIARSPGHFEYHTFRVQVGDSVNITADDGDFLTVETSPWPFSLQENPTGLRMIDPEEITRPSKS